MMDSIMCLLGQSALGKMRTYGTVIWKIFSGFPQCKWLWYHALHHSQTTIMGTKLQLNVPVSWYVWQYKSVSEWGCPFNTCVIVYSTIGKRGSIFHTWLVWVYAPHLASVVVYHTLGKYGCKFHTWQVWVLIPHLASVGVKSPLGKCVGKYFTLGYCGCIFYKGWVWFYITHLPSVGLYSTLGECVIVDSIHGKCGYIFHT